uniref:Major facilitator superfamily (MFS) profile domain-containing protein n=1 Tax=Strigamia maritima TaxID=126957 RepID=T1JA92_STRMM
MFQKKRPLANGIVLAGGAVGSVCIPPFLEYLIDTYGLNGACLIMAGFVMQFFVTASILRALYIVTLKPIKPIIPQLTEVPLLSKTEIIAQEKLLSSNLNFSFMKNCTFIVNAVANAIQASLFLASVTILPDLAVEEMGVSRIQGAYLVSATAFADLSARILAGMCLLRLKMRKSVLYAIVLFINVSALVLLAYVRNYGVALFAAVLIGGCFAFGILIYYELLASCQTAENFPKAFGISEVVKAPILLITASTVGSLKDATGSYETTFLIFVCAETVAMAMWFFEIWWNRNRSSSMCPNRRGPQIFPILDGGFGWWILLAGILTNFVVMGLYKSGGIIYMASVKHLSASRTVAAWVPMVTMMIVFLTAPIATFLATKFTFHRIIFLGGIIATIGMLINYFASDIVYLFIGWSFFFSVGSSFAFFPSLAVVGQCFKKKRPLANGILLSGSSLGCVFMPPLLEYLMDTFGLNGACLIIAGLIMQSFITASILRAVFITTRKPLKPSTTNLPLVANQINEENERTKSFINLNLSFLKNSTLIVNGLAHAIQTALFFAMVTILPDLAVEEMGVTRINGAYLISACGFADLSSRLIAGMCLFKLKLKKSVLYAVILFISVLDLLMLAYVRNYSFVMFGAVLGGVCFAFGMVLYCEVVASVVGAENYPTAFGASEMIKTPFLLVTAATVGSIKDATGSYSATFLIFVAGQLVAMLLWMNANRSTHFTLLDGGLGWLIVAASTICNFIGMGVYRSGGIIYMATVKYFSATRSVAAWVPMITIMLVYFTGKLVNYFYVHIIGVGSSLVVFPALAAVGQCFKAKRPLANSIVLTAAAVGSSFFPPFLEYLIETYGLNGACLLLAGVAMQFLVAAIALRTVFLLTRRPTKQAVDPHVSESEKEDNHPSKSIFHLDLSFVKNCTYLVNGFSSAIQVALFFATLTILPDFAVEETGVSRIQGAYLVSASACADIVSRLPAGICVFKMKLSNSIIYLVILIINVLDLLLLVFIKDYYVAVVAAAIGGACFAFGMVLYFEILPACQTPKNYPAAFGLSEMLKAPFLLLTATSVGSLKDATGSYSTTFLIFAVAESVAMALWIFEIMSASESTHFPILDGGIGWLTVLAGAISNFVAMGFYRSGGIIYMASVKYFSASRSVAAWVPMITMMLVFFTAPIGTFLATKITFHKIAIIGGIFATLGMFINFLANDIETIFIGWSILFGKPI